ncbi:hypothetical protein BGX34_001464 [Mortierella sp. NVP85]|nr:hypothetical protein BGX34_001464 [Mortierella sp. NVP85]
MAPSKSQFHHYIPRFILKTFADNFKLSNSDADFIANTSNVFQATDPRAQPGGCRKGKERKGKRGHQEGTRRPFKPTYHINVYQAKDHSSVLSDIARAYGNENMYRDVNEGDCMKFEKLLGNMENTSSGFIRKIWSGEQLLLTREQLGEMKKFLFIMMYRGEHRRGQYHNDDFDISTRLSILRHMRHKNIEKIRDVWFDNLKWLIETPTKNIIDEYMSTITGRGALNPFAMMRDHRAPIPLSELVDFGNMSHSSICIWQAAEGSEFILSEGCFGAYEGDKGFTFHNFFVVSPRYAIVLVNRLYMSGRIHSMPFRKSWFGDELHAEPEIIYKNGPPRDISDVPKFSLDDVFKYRRIVVSKKDVYNVNSILLDARTKYLTYKSSVCIYRSLRYYDKVKDTMFDYKHDYSILKRKLFADMNRTHAS